MSLTDEERNWLAGRFDALGTALQGLRTEVARLDGKIESVETKLLQEMERLEHRLSGEITRIDERIERTETNLLTEFHKWASPSDSRQRSHSAAIRALDMEFETLRERVANLEKINGVPPPPFG